MRTLTTAHRGEPCGTVQLSNPCERPPGTRAGGPFSRTRIYFPKTFTLTRASVTIKDQNVIGHFFILICNFCLAPNQSSEASSFPDAHPAASRGGSQLPGAPRCRAQPRGLRHPGPLPLLVGRRNKNLSGVDSEKAAPPGPLGNSGSPFLILIGFLIGLFMGSAIARDEKAWRATMCLAFLSGGS